MTGLKFFKTVIGLISVAFAAFLGASLAYLAREYSSIGSILPAIILGGVAGGFTLGLIGGERYGLKLPGKVGRDHRVDPGFVGDIFVGLMSSFLGVGIASRTLKTDLFLVKAESPLHEASAFAELWFLNFAIAYICGFIGLRLVKGLSERFLQELQIKEGLQRVSENEAATAFLSGQSALSLGQLQEAEDQFQKALELDEKNKNRALIGLGRVLKLKKRYKDAITIMDGIIKTENEEPIKERIAVAYWNRACYRTLDLNGNLADPQFQLVFEDLQKSLAMKPAFRDDLMHDGDLKSIKDDDRLKAL